MILSLHVLAACVWIGGQVTIAYQNSHLSRQGPSSSEDTVRQALGCSAAYDEAYYVGFRVGDQEVGLDPHGHSQGMTGPVGYWHVDDINQSLKLLLDAGAETQQAIKDVGGGKQIASVKDADGNIIGLIQSP